MHRNRKPALGLVATALVMSAFTALVMYYGSSAEESLIDPIAGFPNAPYTYDWAAYLIVLCGVACWYVGRWLAKRVPLQAASPRAVVLLSAAYVILGSWLFVGVETGVDLAAEREVYLSGMLPFVMVGAFVFFLGYLQRHADIRAAAGRRLAMWSNQLHRAQSREH